MDYAETDEENDDTFVIVYSRGLNAGIYCGYC